jgi:hypothetical protein
VILSPEEASVEVGDHPPELVLADRRIAATCQASQDRPSSFDGHAGRRYVGEAREHMHNVLLFQCRLPRTIRRKDEPFLGEEHCFSHETIRWFKVEVSDCRSRSSLGEDCTMQPEDGQVKSIFENLHRSRVPRVDFKDPGLIQMENAIDAEYAAQPKGAHQRLAEMLKACGEFGIQCERTDAPTVGECSRG